ncbi:MAG: hypothetical protein K1X72_03430 [Pyrinomonadaceae bacterium]|nr:hypothetical protein [Pyrinomonadaceae bacterium]
MKILFLLTVFIFFSTAFSNEVVTFESFTLKKNESKQIEDFTVKMVSVGHTFSRKKTKIYANLEISRNGKTDKITLNVGETTPLGDKKLKLDSVNEKADPKLSDPFLATSCTLTVS